MLLTLIGDSINKVLGLDQNPLGNRSFLRESEAENQDFELWYNDESTDHFWKLIEDKIESSCS